MFGLIQQVFIGFFSFSGSLATKCMSLNNKLYMTRPTLFDLNPVKFNYCSFIDSLDKSNGNFNNAVDDISAKVCVSIQVKQKM